MSDRTMMSSYAEIATAEASGYLRQLCKHFAHKLAVEVSPAAGSIAFPFGVMRGRAREGAIELTAEAADEAALARLEDVVARHLARFMFREAPKVAWTRL
jgi:hypothetical protein